MLVAAIFLCAVLSLSASEVGLSGRALLFPSETDSSYVTLTPLKSLSMTAFTLCLRIATELPTNRETILFAYRTKYYDELNVWQEKDGRLALYLSGKGAFFRLPPLSPFGTHLCLTWASRSGLVTFWVDGQRSVMQVYKDGHSVGGGGTVILGQDPDNYLGDFDALQSFVGEITDVNMWDHVLSGNQIKALYGGGIGNLSVPVGNVFDWATIKYNIHGRVLVVSND